MAASPNSGEATTTSASACDDAAALVCGTVGEESGVCDLMKRTAPKMDPSRCAAMLADPEQTLADMRRMEESQLPLNEEKQRMLIEGNPPAYGPEDAKVTVVFFSDLHCEQCIYMAHVARELGKEFPSVRVVFRQHPSPLSPFAHVAAQASLAAHAQGAFWDYYKQIYNNQHDINRATIARCAREIGLRMAPFLEALDNNRFKGEVDDDMRLAEQVLAGPAPYFFVNGKRVFGVKSAVKLKDTIEAALKEQEGR